MSEVATYGSATSLVPHNMNEAIRLAEFMATARTVPKHLWDSPGDCLMVVELAMRWGMSPFAVAQATSVISGKQMIEGKLVAAAVENSGAIVGHIDYQFSGEGDGRSITVTATRRGETNPREVTVKLSDAKTTNQMWTRQPDQQLVYHGARVWARRWTPAVILGVYSREEMGPTIEGEVVEEPSDAREQINKNVPLKAAASDMKRPPSVTEPRSKSTHAQGDIYDQHNIAIELLNVGDSRTWMSNLEMLLAEATSLKAVEVIGECESVKHTIEKAPGSVRARVSELLAKACKRFIENDPDYSAEELPEVEIEGADKVAAG